MRPPRIHAERLGNVRNSCLGQLFPECHGIGVGDDGLGRGGFGQAESGGHLLEQIIHGRASFVEGAQMQVRVVGQAHPHQAADPIVGGMLENRRDIPVEPSRHRARATLGPLHLRPQAIGAGLQVGDPTLGLHLLTFAAKVGLVVAINQQIHLQGLRGRDDGPRVRKDIRPPPVPPPRKVPAGRTWTHSGAPPAAEWRARAGPMMGESLLMTGIMSPSDGPQNPDKFPPGNFWTNGSQARASEGLARPQILFKTVFKKFWQGETLPPMAEKRKALHVACLRLDEGMGTNGRRRSSLGPPFQPWPEALSGEDGLILGGRLGQVLDLQAGIADKHCCWSWTYAAIF